MAPTNTRVGIITPEALQAFREFWPKNGFPPEMHRAEFAFDGGGELLGVFCLDRKGALLDYRSFDGPPLCALRHEAWDAHLAGLARRNH